MKYSVFLIQLLISISAFGQKVSLSQAILDIKDQDIAAVCELWQSYVSSNACVNIDSMKNYWDSDEIGQGFTDIVVSTTPLGSYRNSEVSVIEAIRINKTYFRIRSVMTLMSGSLKVFETMFNVYVKKEETGFRLCNSFLVERPFLYQYKTDNINFYIPENLKWSFTEHIADETDQRYKEILKKYGLQGGRKVDYVVCPTLAESYRLIGIFYTPLSNSVIYKGQYIENQNIIISTSENHLHELIHSVFNRYKGSIIFQEGISTFYGGSGGVSYDQKIYELKKLVSNNPGIDLTNIKELASAEHGEVFSLKTGFRNSYFIVGAIFIDYALNIGREKKVLALFNYEDTGNSDYDGFYAAIEMELGIRKDQVNTFLVDYIKNYSKRKSSF